MRNPDVTVRQRGVMEKCTLLRAAHLARAPSTPRSAASPLVDGDVVTACQSACPTQAIHFGDLARSGQRRRAARKASPRHYAMLDELNTRPRTTYLARVVARRLKARHDHARGRGGAADLAGSAVLRAGWGYASDRRQDRRRRADAAAAAGAWRIAFCVDLRSASLVFLGAIGYLFVARRRHLGHQHPGRLGLRDRQLRLVDRHRPRRHLHLGGPAAAAPEVAHLDQPLRRGDDAVRRWRWPGLFPILHLGRPWFFYWLAPYPNTMNLWPQWRSPLVWDFFAIATYLIVSLAVLVPRPDPRPGDAARPRARRCGKQHRLRPARARLARRGAPLGAPRDAPTCCSPAWRRRWWSRCTRSSRSTSRSATRPATTRRSSRPTSSPARCSRASRWC